MSGKGKSRPRKKEVYFKTRRKWPAPYPSIRKIRCMHTSGKGGKNKISAAVRCLRMLSAQWYAQQKNSRDRTLPPKYPEGKSHFRTSNEYAGKYIVIYIDGTPNIVLIP